MTRKIAASSVRLSPRSERALAIYHANRERRLTVRLLWLAAAGLIALAFSIFGK